MRSILILFILFLTSQLNAESTHLNALEIFQAANPNITVSNHTGMNNINTSVQGPKSDITRLNDLPLSNNEKETVFENLKAYFEKDIWGKSLQSSKMYDDKVPSILKFTSADASNVMIYTVVFAENQVILNLIYTIK